MSTDITGRPLAGLRVLGTLRSPELFGAERGSIEVYKVLRDLGAELCVVVPTVMNGGEVRTELERLGFPAVGLPFGFQWSKAFFRRDPRTPFYNLWSWVRCHVGFDRVVRRFRPTHVQLGNALAFNFIEGVVRRHRLPMVIRLGDAAPVASQFQMLLWRRFVARGTQVMANSKFVARDAVAHSPALRRQPPRVIYNVAPSPTETPEEPALDDRFRHVVYLGQLVPEKGVFEFVEAAGLLHGGLPDVQFHLVGGSGFTKTTETALRARVVALGLAKAVFFHGPVKNARRYLGRADVQVTPSLCPEAFANVVLEAKREGTPSVVFPSGGLPEMVQHEVDGVVCRELSSAALAEGIAWMLAEVRRRPGLRAAVAAEYEARFGAQRFIREWTGIFVPEATARV